MVRYKLNSGIGAVGAGEMEGTLLGFGLIGGSVMSPPSVGSAVGTVLGLGLKGGKVISLPLVGSVEGGVVLGLELLGGIVMIISSDG